MGFIRAISRIIIGVVFILSGFFKAIDPIGGGLKIKEYLTAFHLDFFDFISIPAAIVLAGMEFIIGVSILKGLRMRIVSILVFWFMIFFTILTFYLALFNPVKDCGCFGEAIQLTNWETFYKNIVLMFCAVVIFLQRNKFEPIAPKFMERLYLGAYTLFIAGISIYSLVKLPQIDLGDYKAGTDLIQYTEGVEKVYKTVLIYSKDGKEDEFDINNLPDSTWTFIDAKTTLETEGEDENPVNFILKNSAGDYITQDILNTTRPLFFVTYYDVEDVSDKNIANLSKLRDTLVANGALLYLVSGNSLEESEKALEKAHIPLLYTDYKTALSFNRSNGGLTYISDGSVIEKWASGEYPVSTLRKLLARDSEVLMANGVIGDHLFAEICLALIFFMIIIVRVISKYMYKRYMSKTKIEAKIEAETKTEHNKN